MSDLYSRVYWRLGEEFPDVYDDKLALGWWVTLLLIAEGAHPSPGQLPRSVSKGALAKLVDAGLVELLAGDRYRIKGLAAERERRAEQGRVGANARWSQSERSATAMRTHSERSADRNAMAMPAKQSKEEKSKAEQSSRAPARGSTGLSPIEFGPFGLVKEGERHD